MTKPQKPKGGNMRVLSFLSVAGVLVVFCSLQISAQKSCKVASPVSYIASHGANEVIEYGRVQTRRLISGRVLDANGEPVRTAIVDLFPDKGALDEGTRIRSYAADGNGNFCLDDIPDGTYWLRFGTEFFGLKHTVMRVRKTRSGSSRPIEVWLEAGT